MTQDESVSRLMYFIRSVPSHIVVALWSSIPCAGGSTVQNAANVGREGFLRQLDRHYELRQHLFYNFIKLAQAVMLRRGCVAIEWPVSRRYWTLPSVGDFLDRLEFFDARVKGCAYGMRVSEGAHCGKYLAKDWKVMSTIPCMPAKI